MRDEVFKWSYDGSYIAKITKKVAQQEQEEAKEAETQIEEPEERTYISVFQMPECKLMKDTQGDRTSIFIEGLDDFAWAPHCNVLVSTSFPAGENAYPRVIMQQVPSRQTLKTHTMKDCKELRMFWHPQGSYLAVMNMFMLGKREKHSIELFETKAMKLNEIAHLQININRQVTKFHGAVFEPHQAKLAIHATSKRILVEG